MKETVNFDVLRFEGAKNLIRKASRLGGELVVDFTKNEAGNFAVITAELPGGDKIRKSFHEVYGDKVVLLPTAKKPSLLERYKNACIKAGFSFSQKTVDALILLGILDVIEEGEGEL